MTIEAPIFRTERGTLAPKADVYWGTTLHEGPNPDAQPVPEAMTRAIRLPADYTPYPGRQWGMVCDLFDHVIAWDDGDTPAAPDTTCEAYAAVMRGNGVQRPISEWRTFAPEQLVYGAYARVDFEKPLVCIETGERYESLVAIVSDGYVHAGDIHSHGYLGAFFSGTDDLSDFRMDGFHVVIGNIDRKGGTAAGYDTALSITRSGVRFRDCFDPVTNAPRPLTMDDLIGPDREPTSFHENVLEVVKKGEKAPRWGGPATDGNQGTLWDALMVWITIDAGTAVREVRFDDLDDGDVYYTSKANASSRYSSWKKGEDAGAAHLRRPTSAYQGRYDYDDEGDESDALLDALTTSYPGLQPLVDSFRACDAWTDDIVKALRECLTEDLGKAVIAAAKGHALA